MKRSPLAFIVVLILAAFLLPRLLPGSGKIRYLGQEFNMRKAYRSYEDFKDDPNNLATNVLARIEKTIRTAPFPSAFQNDGEVARAVLQLRFPGYGCGGRGAFPQTDGTTCALFSVEIPMTDRERYFVSRTSTNGAVIIDDFVLGLGTNEIKKVQINGPRIQYFNAQGAVLRDKQI
jgi:hypothetical protein